MINKYEFKTDGSTPFLVYSLGEERIPHEHLSLTLLEENINLLATPSDHVYPIMSVYDLMLRSIPGPRKQRTRDKILSEEGIDSFYDLQCAYNLLRNRKLDKSARIRKFVEDKYSEIINLEYDETYETRTSNNDESGESRSENNN